MIKVYDWAGNPYSRMNAGLQKLLLHVFYISLIISLLDDRAKILLKYPWYRLLIIQSYLMF